ncbi:hypothetical protein Scep_007921 [Stephania cephalantha]|uniref:Uncharacterized protein n=1 Tax=Stephania cephalantha TaxID=152367 RepID=A0AAP0KCP6_9MAGN
MQVGFLVNGAIILKFLWVVRAFAEMLLTQTQHSILLFSFEPFENLQVLQCAY